MFGYKEFNNNNNVKNNSKNYWNRKEEINCKKD